MVKRSPGSTYIDGRGVVYEEWEEVRCGTWTHGADCFREHEAECVLSPARKADRRKLHSRAQREKENWHGSADGPGL